MTPNKRLSSGPLQQWQDVRQLQQQGAAQYAYEARKHQHPVALHMLAASCLSCSMQPCTHLHCRQAACHRVSSCSSQPAACPQVKTPRKDKELCGHLRTPPTSCCLPPHPSARVLRSGWLHMQATVGAGLPIISTLQTLLETGDDVQQIEGVFSGTLSYIFNRSGHRPFSLLRTAACTAGASHRCSRLIFLWPVLGQ